ncbi:MAG TPA: cytochrome P450, partial [Myxococcaceae bacterium]
APTFLADAARSIPEPDFSSERFKANPFPFYARLRAEAPVFPLQTFPLGIFGKRRGWLVTRYDDVVAVLKHKALAKDVFRALSRDPDAKLPWFVNMIRPITHNMLNRDPPDHTRLRGLVHQAFTPHLVERLRARIQSLTNELLDAMQKKGSADLVADYALPVPVTIIAEMLGVPEGDRARFHRYSSRLVSNTTPLRTALSAPTVLRFARYIRKLIEQRRASPGEDLLTALIRAEEAGDRLSEDELVSMIFLMLVAGHETTVNLIASGTLALLEHPDQMERLRQEPGLMPTAVEELVRFTSPVEISTMRVAVEDFTVGGVTIPRGDIVTGVIASANRDERHFTNPDQLDIGRDPNRHLSFGMGMHYCLGAPLARLEGSIAIQNLLQRLPRLRLAKPAESLRWRTSFFMRGLHKLPVVF